MVLPVFKIFTAKINKLPSAARTAKWAALAGNCQVVFERKARFKRGVARFEVPASCSGF